MILRIPLLRFQDDVYRITGVWMSGNIKKKGRKRLVQPLIHTPLPMALRSLLGVDSSSVEVIVMIKNMGVIKHEMSARPYMKHCMHTK